MIYFDNGATSYPKPFSVVNAVQMSFCEFCANPGRGGYKSAMKSAEMIYNARESAAKLFNADAENVIFTSGCTFSLNTAVKGLCRKGSHFVISDLEHNSVLRPLERLRRAGLCEYSVAEITPDVSKTVSNFVNAFRKNTVAVICTLSSNVFGIMPPIERIALEAHKHGILFVLDAAQGAGYLPVDMKKDKTDIICCAGHKGLFGPMGTGLLIISKNVSLNTLIEGGTGSNSESLNQPSVSPDRFESGTPNVHGIAGLWAGINFVQNEKCENILSHEKRIIKYIYDELKACNNVILYTDFYDGTPKSPVLSFNIKSRQSEEIAALLAENGICVRGGLHCAPLAHKKFSTIKSGTVRITPSWFTSEKEAEFLVNCIKKIAK